jgi:hypothetical protein
VYAAHIYTFAITAPGGPLTFAVGDDGIGGGFVDIQFVERIDRDEFPLMTDGLRMTETEYLDLRSQGLSYGHAHPGAYIDLTYAVADGASTHGSGITK